MPELPEVETFKRYFDKAALQQKILEVEVHDDKIIRNVSGAKFRNLCRGRTFKDSKRIGKYLFGQMDNQEWIQFHFGMTGDILLYNEDELPPRHERFHFQFSDGLRLGFDCPRKFARIVHITSLPEYIIDTKLGVDALEMKLDDFLNLAQGKKSTIKGFLLNQKIIAGIGNLYADEVCYQTKVHPGSKTGSIPLKKQKEIFHSFKKTLRTAVEKAAYYKDYPDDWFWKWRDVGKKPPKGHGKIEISKIAGRTTYCFPKIQKLYD